MQTTLLAQDRREQPDVGQRPRRPVKVGLPNGCSAISRHDLWSSGVTFDADEGDPVGTGNSTETHSHSLVRPAPRRSGNGLESVVAATPIEARIAGVYLTDHGITFQHVGIACQHGRHDHATIGTARRWSMLAIALTATLCANVFINGVAFLIPTLHTERGLDLAEAGLMSSLPSFGMVVTLIAWGYIVDRFGERIVLAVGSALTAAAAFGAASVHSLVAVGAFLFLGGMAAASSNSASGRLVVGWFPPDQRGLVMGIRQTATAAGSRPGRVGDSAARRGLRRRGGPAVPRDRVRRRGGDQRGRRARPAAAATRRGARGRPRQPLPRIVDAVAHPRRLGAAGRAAVPWSGRSPWCG